MKTTEEKLKTCTCCLKRGFDPATGTICSLTKEFSAEGCRNEGIYAPYARLECSGGKQGISLPTQDNLCKSKIYIYFCKK